MVLCAPITVFCPRVVGTIFFVTSASDWSKWMKSIPRHLLLRDFLIIQVCLWLITVAFAFGTAFLFQNMDWVCVDIEFRCLSVCNPWYIAVSFLFFWVLSVSLTMFMLGSKLVMTWVFDCIVCYPPLNEDSVAVELVHDSAVGGWFPVMEVRHVVGGWTDSSSSCFRICKSDGSWRRLGCCVAVSGTITWIIAVHTHDIIASGVNYVGYSFVFKFSCTCHFIHIC